MACSPVDTVGHSCARGADNDVGFYECKHYRIQSSATIDLLGLVASSWEMSFFAPHSMATIIELMGGNDTFISRLYVLSCEFGIDCVLMYYVLS